MVESTWGRLNREILTPEKSDVSSRITFPLIVFPDGLVGEQEGKMRSRMRIIIEKVKFLFVALILTILIFPFPCSLLT